jgi:hypothetical protein
MVAGPGTYYVGVAADVWEGVYTDTDMPRVTFEKCCDSDMDFSLQLERTVSRTQLWLGILMPPVVFVVLFGLLVVKVVSVRARKYSGWVWPWDAQAAGLTSGPGSYGALDSPVPEKGGVMVMPKEISDSEIGVRTDSLDGELSTRLSRGGQKLSESLSVALLASPSASLRTLDQSYGDWVRDVM